MASFARTSKHFGHVDVVLRDVSYAEMDHLELALLSVVAVQDVQDGLHRAIHVTWVNGCSVSDITVGGACLKLAQCVPLMMSGRLSWSLCILSLGLVAKRVLLAR